MRKLIRISLALCIIGIVVSFAVYKSSPNNINDMIKKKGNPFKKVAITEDCVQVDANKNGVWDPMDIVNAARLEAKNKTNYKSEYYIGGYPPEGEGVCTDVIWRGLKGAGIDLKTLVDKDIAYNKEAYYRIKDNPDPNIDFRRVPNLDVFFKRNAINLTTEVKPFDVDNLKQWQPGDIVVFLKPYEHIGIISNKRSNNGIPYIIHNSKPHASEVANFNLWNAKIAGHYRWDFNKTLKKQN